MATDVSGEDWYKSNPAWSKLNDFRSGEWDGLEAAAQKKLGLPQGILSALRTGGEKTNANIASSSQARTPYQFIPATRDSIIKKYGFDPLLSPENAVLGAAHLAKEGLDRNKGDVEQAVGEYHGGINRKAWGPVNSAYRARVMRAMGQEPAKPEGQGVAAPPKLPLLSDIKGQVEEEKGFSIFKAFDAYEKGKMDSEAEKAFEMDLIAGNLKLPVGKKLKGAAHKDWEANNLPIEEIKFEPLKVNDKVLEAWRSGKMDKDSAAMLEADLKAGRAVPDVGIVNRVLDAFSGTQRTTPDSQKLPNWTEMPELQEMSTRAAKASVGTMLTGEADETKNILAANIDKLGVEKDALGNYIFTSPSNGKKYAYKPGFDQTDSIRMAGQVAAFIPAARVLSVGKAFLAGAGTQAGIEGARASMGGEFKPMDVATSGVLTAVFPFAQKVGGAIRNLVTNEGATALAAQRAAGQAGQVAPEAAAKALTQEEAAALVRGVAREKVAPEKLAEQIIPDESLVKATQALGMESPIPVTVSATGSATQQPIREMVGVVRSPAGSAVRAQEFAFRDELVKKADDLIEQMATKDASQVSDSIKTQMKAESARLKSESQKAFGEVGTAMEGAQVSAPETLKFLKDRAAKLGGDKHLSQAERDLLSIVMPKDVSSKGDYIKTFGRDKVKQILEGLEKSGKSPDAAAAMRAELDGSSQMTYGLLDDKAKKIAQAMRDSFDKSGFGELGSDVITGLKQAIDKDQMAAVAARGLEGKLDSARSLWRARSDLIDKQKTLFGEAIDKEMTAVMKGAMSGAGSQDVTVLRKMLAALPDDAARQEAIGSSLIFSMGNKGQGLNPAQFVKFYEGMAQNSQAMSMVMGNLPKPAQEQLTAIYRVSKALRDAEKTYTTTGKQAENARLLQGTDTLIERLYEGAKQGLTRGAIGAAATSAFGAPAMGFVGGFSTALASALKGRKDRVTTLADKVLASPEFMHLIRTNKDGAPSPGAVKSLVKSDVFKRMADSLKAEFGKDEKSRAQWVSSAFPAANNKAKE